MKSSALLSVQERKQQQLARHCFWDDVEQLLYIDARNVFPNEGVISILGWDAMMMSSLPIPSYPSYFKIMAWAKHPHFSDWLKQIPKWVQDSCLLFPSHQMQLLHYAGKYPQVLELLDHAPMLAWRLVKAQLTEPEVVTLLSGKRTLIAKSVGWPGKTETVKILTNLRLRWVTPEIAEQIDACLFDEQRLSALQDLPRINSMALSLAARFPGLIGSKLHHALAQLPCRPMQCQSMVALLEDAYAAAEYLQLPLSELDSIGNSRYLVEVTEIYQAWLKQVEQQFSELKALNLTEGLALELNAEPKKLLDLQQWQILSQTQQHIWLINWPDKDNGSTHQSRFELVAWQDEEGVWGALVHSALPPQPSGRVEPAQLEHEVIKVRGLENSLPGAKQLSTLHLWQAKQLRQE